MLRLLIDNMDVALNSDASFEFFRENPFIKNSGDYTYDIDIDIKNKTNAIVYSGIERVNNRFNITGRSAVLLDGPTVICRGTEVILEKDGNNVKIQIVAGNSELNYLVSNNDKVRELELGTIEQKDKDDIVRDINKFYPDVNYNYPPLILTENGNYKMTDNVPMVVGPNIYFDDLTSFRPQPFLMYYVERILQSIGYEIKDNMLLQQDKWKRLLLVNGYNTREYSKMLPDWTVKDFVEQLEKFFGCVFLVDKDKGVTISDVNTYYSNSNRAYYFSDNVVDDFGRKFDEDEGDYLLSVSGLEYNLPKTSLEWKLANIDEDIWRRVTIVDKDFDIHPEQEGWDNFTVFRDPGTGMLYKTYLYQQDGTTQYLSKGVNFYAKSVADRDGNNLSLSIIPAMTTVTEQDYEIGAGIYRGFGGAMVVKTEYHEYEDNTAGFYENINGEVVQNEVQDFIETAFYLGALPLRVMSSVDVPVTEPTQMVMTATKRYHLMDNQLHGIKDDEVLNYDSSWDLTPEARMNNEFRDGLKIDKKQKYIFQIRTQEILDPKFIFNIRGRKFACIKLTYRWTNLQQCSLVEGEFYELI